MDRSDDLHTVQACSFDLYEVSSTLIIPRLLCVYTLRAFYPFVQFKDEHIKVQTQYIKRGNFHLVIFSSKPLFSCLQCCKASKMKIDQSTFLSMRQRVK